MKNKTLLQERCTRFLTALGLPVTAFSRMIGISPSAVYKWRSGLLKLSEGTERKIEQILLKYDY